MDDQLHRKAGVNTSTLNLVIHASQTLQCMEETLP